MGERFILLWLYGNIPEDLWNQFHSGRKREGGEGGKEEKEKRGGGERGNEREGERESGVIGEGGSREVSLLHRALSHTHL